MALPNVPIKPYDLIGMFHRTRMISFAAAASVLVACFFALAASDDPAVPYPQGYRHWSHLHSTIVGPKHGAFAKRPCESPCTGGIYHFYANQKAMEGFRTGKFADGSIIADEVLETRQPSSGTSIEGPRRLVGVMVKDSQRYSATEGWGYGGFTGDNQTEDLTSRERKECFQCHVSRKEHDFVFTEYRER
jgi:hypothetical protein